MTSTTFISALPRRTPHPGHVLSPAARKHLRAAGELYLTASGECHDAAWEAHLEERADPTSGAGALATAASRVAQRIGVAYTSFRLAWDPLWRDSSDLEQAGWIAERAERWTRSGRPRHAGGAWERRGALWQELVAALEGEVPTAVVIGPQAANRFARHWPEAWEVRLRHLGAPVGAVLRPEQAVRWLNIPWPLWSSVAPPVVVWSGSWLAFTTAEPETTRDCPPGWSAEIRRLPRHPAPGALPHGGAPVTR